jgi:2',3'-cyclic-nucleotide 2'-phosphodiesterase
MKILFIGDIVGKFGRRAVISILPKLKKKYHPDLVIANAENAAHGSGMTEATIKELMEAGVNCITSGDHAFARPKQIEIFEKYPVLRPANFPSGVPGKGWSLIQAKNGKSVLLINLIGRVFMKKDYDCPFRRLDEILNIYNLANPEISAIIIDIHAEATSEKVSMKHYADGRVSAVLGTHTHIATADHHITAKKTAYITDVGMAGAADESLGIGKENIIKTFLTQISYPHVIPEKGKAMVNSALVDLDEKGKAKNILPITEYKIFNE